MHTDLPSAIRDALHDSQITEADLRQPELRSTQRHRFGAFAAAATAVAAVATVAVVVAVANWPGADTSGGGTTAGGGGNFSDVLGYQWRVTGLTDAAGTLSVPDAHGAMIGYTRHGYVVADDSVNSIGAHYTATADGYTVSDAATTLVAYAGGDVARKRVIGAVNAMFFAFADSVDATPPPVEVTVRLDGDTLTLVSGETTLTLARDGEQPEMSDMTPAQTGKATPEH
jgi:hypothetical protein